MPYLHQTFALSHHWILMLSIHELVIHLFLLRFYLQETTDFLHKSVVVSIGFML